MLEAIRKALALAELLAGLVPIVRSLVEVVEVPGAGALKAEAVVSIVRGIWQVIPEDLLKAIVPDKLEAFIKIVIEWTVKIYNATGKFVKSG